MAGLLPQKMTLCFAKIPLLAAFVLNRAVCVFKWSTVTYFTECTGWQCRNRNHRNRHKSQNYSIVSSFLNSRQAECFSLPLHFPLSQHQTHQPFAIVDLLSHQSALATQQYLDLSSHKLQKVLWSNFIFQRLALNCYLQRQQKPFIFSFRTYITHLYKQASKDIITDYYSAYFLYHKLIGSINALLGCYLHRCQRYLLSIHLGMLQQGLGRAFREQSSTSNPDYVIDLNHIACPIELHYQILVNYYQCCLQVAKLLPRSPLLRVVYATLQSLLGVFGHHSFKTFHEGEGISY